ncbi:hypothetical protein MBBAR_16c00020 [Methanobrevibacter arboriphilus JCM 13429 = DSM 1125]|uniref:Uncharacterized protein n=1 Tax=Methanobrevibacter arboriphilus JCM 13429 = DSM 1125 TaxID=1300164 RepID=A0A1V6N131_METAZ|nr:hypothetical protein [Methanobrevibacter arboriphilus]OQD58399.1 hypothetical protein MBBAR_16c00020 [Methanobrevibacter arboriphilus JCM 13429 = DSM 1125]
MKKKYLVILIIIIIVGIAFASSLFIFQGDEKDVCSQCKMLNCHDHATGDNYCCDMCSMEENSKCNCPMPMKENNNSENNASENSNSKNNNSNISMNNSLAENSSDMKMHNN